MTNGDDTQYAGSDQPQTADQQKASDQKLLDETPAPRAELVKPPTAQPTPESDSGGQLPNVSDMYKLGLKLYMDSEAQIEKNNARLQPLYDKLNQSLSQPLPELPKFQDVPPPPSQDQLNQQLNKGRLTYLAIGLPLALMLGRRGKNAAWYAMGAFGQGLTQLQQNNVQGARDMFSTWQEAAKYAQEENNQRIDTYKMVLENRNLTLNQQTALIENLSRQLNDPYINRAAMAKDMIGIAGQIAQAESQGVKFSQETDKLSIQMLDKMGSTPEGQSYRSKILADKKNNPDGIDPFNWRDSASKHKGDYMWNYHEAEKILPYDQFNKDYWKQQKGATGLDLEGTNENQQYIDANKKVGVEGMPHVDNKADYDKLPSGAYWVSSDESVHGPKP